MVMSFEKIKISNNQKLIFEIIEKIIINLTTEFK